MGKQYEYVETERKMISREQINKNCPRCQNPLELIKEQWKIGEEVFNAEVVYCSKRSDGLVLHSPSYGTDYELVLRDPWEDPSGVKLAEKFPEFHRWGPYGSYVHGTLEDIDTKKEYCQGKEWGAVSTAITEEQLKALKEHLGKEVEIGIVTHELDDYDESVTTGGRIYKRLHFEYTTAGPTLISICGEPISYSRTSIEYIKYQEKILFERYKGAAGRTL